MVCSSSVFAKISPGAVTIGIVSVDTDGVSISTTNDSLSDKNVLMCVDTLTKPKKCSLLLGSKFIDTITDGSVSDVFYGKSIYTFKHTMNVGRDAGIFYGIAVIYPAGRDIDYSITLGSHPQELSLLLSEENMIVNLCTSKEGVHVYSPQNKKSMHLYLNLGYEVMPTCSDEVYR